MTIRLVAVLIITGSIIAACSGLSKSESTLRRNYLAITQPGISMEQAATLIKRKIKPEGAMVVRENTPCLEREETRYQIGSHSIRANLGWYYWGSMHTPVYAEWCFNQERKLVDIVVYKNIDDTASEHDYQGLPPENR